MGRGRPLKPLDVSSETREELESLANSRTLAAGLVQAVDGSLLRREGHRHCWVVSQSTRPRDGAVCRREEPDPGTGTFTASTASGTWIRRRGNTRLHPARNDDPVRGARRGLGQGD